MMKQIFTKTELSMKIFGAGTLTLLGFFSYYVLYEIATAVHDDAFTLMYIPILFSVGSLLFSFDLFQDKNICPKILGLIASVFSLFTLWALWTHVGVLFFS